MFLIQHRRIAYWISGILVVASIISIAVWGLRLGIDFAGGALLEVSYTQSRPSVAAVQQALSSVGLKTAQVQPSGDKNLLIRMKDISEEEHRRVRTALENAGGSPEELRFDSIGPTIGKELRNKSLTAIVLVVLMIVLYMTWAFRKVSKPLSSWRYGVIAIAALMHDVIIPTGIFAALGHFLGVEVDTLFVTALLTVLGFSVHDTIVVFDRTRENLLKHRGQWTFDVIVGKSVRQTLSRSINTSFTTMLVLAALLVWGPVSTRYLSLALLLGIFFGTYSSIFIASPLLVSWSIWREKKHATT